MTGVHPQTDHPEYIKTTEEKRKIVSNCLSLQQFCVLNRSQLHNEKKTLFLEVTCHLNKLLETPLVISSNLICSVAHLRI